VQPKTGKLGQVFLREIKRNYGDAMFLTREDLLQLPIFGHVSTIYRYKLICDLVTKLVEEGELIAKSNTNLCLKSKSNSYEDTPLRLQYYDVIKAVASAFGRTAFTVMDVVDHWATDPQLTTNNKRVAVRQTMGRLIREEVIKPHGEFSYMVKGKV